MMLPWSRSDLRLKERQRPSLRHRNPQFNSVLVISVSVTCPTSLESKRKFVVSDNITSYGTNMYGKTTRGGGAQFAWIVGTKEENTVME